MVRIPLPSRKNPLVSMGPCPEILLESRVLRFDPPYPKMAMISQGRRPAIFIFRGKESSGGPTVDAQTVRKYERFNMRKVRHTSTVELELSGWEPVGQVVGEVYMSDKEGHGSDQEYVHEHTPPLPTLYRNVNDDVYCIYGGKFTVDEWIEG